MDFTLLLMRDFAAKNKHTLSNVVWQQSGNGRYSATSGRVHASPSFVPVDDISGSRLSAVSTLYHTLPTTLLLSLTSVFNIIPLRV